MTVFKYKNGKLVQVAGNSGGGSGSTTPPDAELNATSENSVQNKVITSALNELQNQINDKKLELVQLWTISDTSSIDSFTYGAITLPSIYDYNIIAVMFRVAKATVEDFLVVANVETNRTNLVNRLTWDTVFKRVFTITSNGINFQQAYQVTGYGTSGPVANNNVLIPIYIFGIK